MLWHERTTRRDRRALFGRHRADRIIRLEFRSGLRDSVWLAIWVAQACGCCRDRISPREIGLSIDTYEVMCKNVKSLGLADVVTIVRRPSAQAIEIIKQPIDLLFIDGDHSL
jgi:hypothetical protein